jgi:hypothetical protein
MDNCIQSTIVEIVIAVKGSPQGFGDAMGAAQFAVARSDLQELSAQAG